MRPLRSLVIVGWLAAWPTAGVAAPAARVDATEVVGLETFTGSTKAQRREVQRIASSLARADLEWVLDTAKRRLSDPPTAFDDAAIETEIEERFPEAASDTKLKIHLVLLQVMMGDVAGALRSYARLMDKDMRRFTRAIVGKLAAQRNARDAVVRAFARSKPPRAYAGQNPSQAARAQDKSSKYTQFVQMNTQLMSELENTERELVDALQTGGRRFAEVWAALHPADDD